MLHVVYAFSLFEQQRHHCSIVEPMHTNEQTLLKLPFYYQPLEEQPNLEKRILVPSQFLCFSGMQHGHTLPLQPDNSNACHQSQHEGMQHPHTVPLQSDSSNTCHQDEGMQHVHTFHLQPDSSDACHQSQDEGMQHAHTVSLQPDNLKNVTTEQNEQKELTSHLQQLPHQAQNDTSAQVPKKQSGRMKC